MKWLALLPVLLLAACDGGLWNDPYPASDAGKSIIYTAFTARPKHLDPVQAYSENEYIFLAQIYQPPLQYHYLKRPYTLIPQAASEMPLVRYYDRHDKLLPKDAPADKIAYSVYEIHLRHDLKYQPHPALAKDASGKPRYFDLTKDDLSGIHSLTDFKYTGTRAVTAADYVYQIKRLVHPDLYSPIYGVMAQYIVGLKEYAKTLQKARKKQPDGWLNLNDYPLPGVQVVDEHTYRIRIIGKYPQFIYWLAMPFFAPMPWEAERFYAQPGMHERNLTLDWWPLGSGPYYLSENNPNERMVLTKNPNFSGEYYPSEAEPGDRAAGFLADAGKPLPLTGKVVFTLEKEAIPYWNKFLEGYYDSSGITSDSFDQAVQVSAGGEANVTDAMKAKGIQLTTSVATSTLYLGFNWLDPVVGGPSERARKLRQAISIAVDWEEFISIFANGRGIAAQSPIPPGIFGYREGEAGINHYVYDWVKEPLSKSLVERVANPNGNDRKARDEGRSPDYDAEERNTASTRVGRNPSGQGFAGSLPCQAPSEGNQPFASSPSSHPIPQSRCRDHEGLAQRLQGQPKRKPIEFAQKLLAEAGYPDGIDAKTGQPLVLYLDTTSTGVGEKARLDWIRKQFAKLNIQLVLRNTDYNRFQDKVNKGATQMFYYGWNADYPDPENFLFLLTSAQTKVGHDGENAANYSNPEYDRLFEQMKNMDNGPARQAIIDRMVEILRHDAPWMWGEHPKDFVLHHSWLYNSKPNKLATNNLKYLRVDAKLRDEMRKKWNQPRLWPLALLGIALAALGWSLRRALRQREESR